MALGNQTFGFMIPSYSLMGVGCSDQVGAQAKSLGATNILLVTDKVLNKLGMADKIKAQLVEAGMKVTIFDGADANPKDINIVAGLEVYKNNKCDGIVTLGGGSSHDCGKGIGIVAGNGGKISDYEGFGIVPKPMPPLIAINTTAGTGSELSGGCVITNTTTHVKMAIIDVHAVPTVGINDPLLMVGMPPALTASTGMDAMTHAVEGYVANFANPLTECLDLQAIRLVNDYLPAAVANGQNVVARDKMAYAEWIAGSTMCNAGLGLVHGMAHQLGGFYNLPHGVCNAILLPVVCDFNLIACPQRFADIAVALHQDITGLDAFEAGQKGIAAIRRLSKSIGIPASLSELGPVKESDFETLAPNALKDVCTFFNPRTATLKEVIGMYKAAM